jgi:glutamyl-tRNA synthetase
MGLRRVHIQSFGKMNFVHTVLSKRKLTWFVENNLVEGWFDPRFPTVQGIMRRGVNIDALKNFILSQGASRRVITMEWDKFWSENKKVLEDTAPRYMGVTESDKVQLQLTNIVDDEVPNIVTVELFPGKPDRGTRACRRSGSLLVDQVDAQAFTLNEQITLLRYEHCLYFFVVNIPLYLCIIHISSNTPIFFYSCFKLL